MSHRSIWEGPPSRKSRMQLLAVLRAVAESAAAARAASSCGKDNPAQVSAPTLSISRRDKGTQLLIDAKVDSHRLVLYALVDLIENIDLERLGKAVAGQIFERRVDDELICTR